MKDSSATPEEFNPNYEERREPFDPAYIRTIKSVPKPSGTKGKPHRHVHAPRPIMPDAVEGPAENPRQEEGRTN